MKRFSFNQKNSSVFTAATISLLFSTPLFCQTKACAQSADPGSSPSVSTSIPLSSTTVSIGTTIAQTALPVTDSDKLKSQTSTDSQSGNGPNAPSVPQAPGTAVVDSTQGLIPTVQAAPHTPSVPDASVSVAAVASSPQGSESLAAISATPQLTLTGNQTFANGLGLDLSSATASIAAPISAPIIIHVGGSIDAQGAVTGGASVTITPGQMITPSQYVAITQVIEHGSQNIVLASNGSADSGTLSLSASQTGTLSSLVLPSHVSLGGIGFGTSNPLSVTGQTDISGSLFALQTAPDLASVFNFGSLSISGLVSGNASQFPVLGSTYSSSGLFSSAALNLNTQGSFQNSGIINSVGQLNISSGSTFSNQGTLSGTSVNVASIGSFTNAGSIVASTGNIGINSLSGNFVNSGLINAAIGGININSTAQTMLANISFDNSGGIVSAGKDINLRSAIEDITKSAVASKVDTYIKGGDLLSQNLNIDSYGGTASIDVGNISGTVNSIASIQHLVSSGPLLSIGSQNISDDPTYYNTGGSIFLGGAQVFNGQSVAIIASGDVTINGALRTTPGIQSGDATVIAGANITSPSTVNNLRVGPDSTTSVTVNGSSVTGGSISINNVITSAGGDITLVAHEGTAANSGNISVGGSSINASGVGGSGSVKIFAEGSVNVKDVNGAAVSISGGAQVSGTQTYLNGELASGSFILAPIKNGGPVNAGNISGGGAITIGSGSTINTGNISGGSPISITTDSTINTGNISGQSASVFISSKSSVTTGNVDLSGGGGAPVSGSGGNGGSLSIIADSDVSTGYIRAFGGGGAGGGGINIPADLNGGNGGNGGSVTLQSNQGAVTINGDINLSGGGGGGAGAAISPGSSGFLFFSGSGGDGGSGGVVNVTSGVSGSINIAGPILTGGGGGGAPGGTVNVPVVPDGSVTEPRAVGGGGGGSFGGGGGGGASYNPIVYAPPSGDGSAGGGFYPGGDAYNQYGGLLVFHYGGGGGGFGGSGTPGIATVPFLITTQKQPVGFNFGDGGSATAGHISQSGDLPGGGLAGADGSVTLLSPRDISITGTVASTYGPSGAGFASSSYTNQSINAGVLGSVNITTGPGYISGTSSSAYLNNANYDPGAPTSTVNLSSTKFTTAGDIKANSIFINGIDKGNSVSPGVTPRGLNLSIEEGGSTRFLSSVNNLTPAEYIALVQQIATGSQTIVLSGTSLGTGFASGGSFDINSYNLPVSGNFNNLVLPSGVTANVYVPEIRYDTAATINGTFNFIGSSTHVLNVSSLTLNSGIISAPGGLTVKGIDPALSLDGSGTITAPSGSIGLFNANGSILISGTTNFLGPLTAIASSDVSVLNRILNARGINFIAGANISQGTSPNTFVVSDSSSSGGAVFITGFGNTVSTNSGGNLGLYAFEGSTPGTGSGVVLVQPALDTGTFIGSGANGNVTIYGGATTGNAVSVVDIITSPHVFPMSEAGKVDLASGPIVIDGPGTMTFVNGQQTAGGNLTVPSAAGGAVVTNNIAANGQSSASSSSVSVNVRSGSTVTTGDINVSPAPLASNSAGGHVTINSTGSISTGFILASGNGTGAGGAVALTSNANIDVIHATGGVSIAANGAGGTINILTGNGAPSLSSVSYFNDANYDLGASANNSASIIGSHFTSLGTLQATGGITINGASQGTSAAAGTYAKPGSITINESGTNYVITNSDLLTPSEFIALVQIATTGSQSIILTGTGAGTGYASGGSFSVASANLPAVGNFNDLVLPSGVTANVTALSLTYDNTATIGGILNLNATNPLLITPSLTVNGTLNAPTGLLTIQSNGTSNSLVVSGTGSISAATGNIAFNGTGAANSGSINLSGLTSVSANAGSGSVNFNGTTNIVSVSANRIAGTVTGSGNGFAVSTNTGTLSIGSIASTDALSITSGNSDLVSLATNAVAQGSSVTVNTPNLTLGANSQINATGTGSGNAVSIQSNAAGFALNITMNSGSQITTASGGNNIFFNKDNAGDISVNGGSGTANGLLSASGNVSLNGGAIDIRAGQINGTIVSGGSSISSSSVLVSSGDLNIGTYNTSGGTSFTTNGASDVPGNDILVNGAINSGAGNLTLQAGTGNNADVKINNNLTTTGALAIDSGNSGSGASASDVTLAANMIAQGGTVIINTPQLTGDTGSQLLSTTGDMTITGNAATHSLQINLSANAIVRSTGVLNFNNSGAANEGAVSIQGASGTQVQGNPVNYNVGANSLNVIIDTVSGTNNVFAASGNPTGISFTTQNGNLTFGTDLNTQSATGDGGGITVNAAGGAIDFGGNNIIASGGGALGNGGAVSLSGSTGITNGGNIISNGSTTGSGDGGAINIFASGNNNILVNTLQSAGGLTGNGGSITSSSFNLSVVGIGPSGDSVFAGGVNGGTVSITTTSTNPFIAGNPIPNGTASGMSVNATGGSGGSIIIASDGVKVNDTVTVSANGAGAGSGGLIVFDGNNPSNPYPTYEINGIVSAVGGAANPNTGIVGFGSDANQGLALYVGANGKVSAGQQITLGNLDPLTGLPSGAQAASIYVSPFPYAVPSAIFNTQNLVVNGRLVFPPTPKSTALDDGTTGGAGISLNLALINSRNQNDALLGLRIPVDLTQVFFPQQLNQTLEQDNNNEEIARQIQIDPVNEISAILTYKSVFDASELNIFTNAGIKTGSNTNGNHIQLDKGNIIFAPDSDIVVETKLGSINIPGGSIVFIMANENDFALFNLHQTKQGAVTVTSNNKQIATDPGNLIVLTNQQARNYERVNGSFRMIGYRNPQQEDINDDIHAFAMNFSIPSLISNVNALKDMLTQENGTDRNTLDKILKNTALLGDLTAKAGPFASQTQSD